jgi:hypothetical protein
MSGAASILVLIYLILLCLIVLSIFSIRVAYAFQVHTLWFLFSLSTCLSIVFLMYRQDISETTVSAWAINAFFDMTTNTKAELQLISAVLLITVVPQFMSYLLAGAFGCGSRPVFVSSISKLAALSLIKFFCIMAGVLTARITYGYLTNRLQENPLYDGWGPLLLLTVSFGSMALYYHIPNLYSQLILHDGFRWIGSVGNYMRGVDRA